MDHTLHARNMIRISIPRNAAFRQALVVVISASGKESKLSFVTPSRKPEWRFVPQLQISNKLEHTGLGLNDLFRKMSTPL